MLSVDFQFPPLWGGVSFWSVLIKRWLRLLFQIQKNSSPEHECPNIRSDGISQPYSGFARAAEPVKLLMFHLRIQPGNNTAGRKILVTVTSKCLMHEYFKTFYINILINILYKFILISIPCGL